ncbi:Asp23/Gls24 family envelope stress response protein [Companilactobacillus mishanensis]|uniref:Asp23/Gls24 family envelope stress response protein n=1 Tax=Companilactobacillus mishanensis TaxID=2486008 RepID=A0A5P0ZEK2_9LACO|nr:Asp23/Gls24 family envelope stress response protein [Companilactobacillus mishanensis]MQS44420.1 Asp23/Gls24 family envelope stress response protein [Companilactobacillus mishanensis]MQS51476.1 Asp23/Gls24 family envelope stress response protein [Companilactobacillus mishanensis]MQS88663.1 Asp23/Gls24 family envelope stress response protein [Companilactobacillus mishanensis]
MAITIKTKHGEIDVSNNTVATIVGGAAADIYGIVGMASKNQLRDGMNTILNREDFSRGVVIHQEDEKLAVDVYIIVGYGIKISEVAKNLKEKVKYNLETMLGTPAGTVNVYVQGIKVLDDIK